jgi:serine/threonine protein kinase
MLNREVLTDFVCAADRSMPLFDEPESAYILTRVLRGLHHLHSHGKVYGNLRLEQVCLSPQGQVKLQFSRDFYGENQPIDNEAWRSASLFRLLYAVCAPLLSDQAGATDGQPLDVSAPTMLSLLRVRYSYRSLNSSVWWTDPVLLRDPESRLLPRHDIWSLGIMCFELANGRPPLAELHPHRAYFRIARGISPSLEEGSAEFKDFVARCLQNPPAVRATAAELLEHPFILSAPESLSPDFCLDSIGIMESDSEEESSEPNPAESD